MTYRERREAKADRLDAWAESRHRKADEQRARTPDSLRKDWAFITQPGRIPERDRMRAADERAYRHDVKASDFEARASGIRAQADRAIYDDDPDAIERLEEKIARLDAERTRQKQINATLRKARRADHTLPDDWHELLDPPLTAKEAADVAGYGQMMRGNYRSYNGFVSHISTEIRRCKKRIESIKQGPIVRFIYARRDGECPECDELIVKGGVIANPDDVWMHGECARSLGATND